MIDFFLGLSPGLLVASLIIAFIALVSQMSLYAKAGQTPFAALVPIWNVVVFCKVVGRPAKHALLLIIPGIIITAVIGIYYQEFDGLFPSWGEGNEMVPGSTTLEQVQLPLAIIGAAMIPVIYIMVVMFIEVCDSFGKHSTIDKILCVFFNGIYILFVLGISNAEYEAPWWAKKRGLPYYMPDFKHKGKKYLVTPEGPIVGDPRKQKVKVEIVNEEDDPIHGIVSSNSDDETAPKTETPVKEAEQELKDSSKATTEKVVEQKETPQEDKTDKEEKVTAVKEEKTVVEPEKKEGKKSKKKSSDTERSGSLAETQKRFSKKDNEGKTKESSGKSWRDEMLEKYKKKK